MPASPAFAFFSAYRKAFKEQFPNRDMQVFNKFAIKNHAESLIEDFGLQTCIEVAEYHIEHMKEPGNIVRFLFRFSESYEAMIESQEDANKRRIQREKMYEAMEKELNVGIKGTRGN